MTCINYRLNDACYNRNLVEIKKIFNENKKYENFFEPITKAFGISLDINLLYNGYNALLLMCDYGNVKIVKELLKISNIDINIKDINEVTALMRACINGHTEVVKELLKTPGIDYNAIGWNKNTALIFAIKQGHIDIVKELLKIPDIDYNIRDINDYTALMYAYAYQHKKIIFLLWNRVYRDIEHLPLPKEIKLHIISKYL